MLKAKSRKACETKVRHSTEEAAQREVCRMFETKAIRCVAYKCGYCSGWHTGHLRREQKQFEQSLQITDEDIAL